MRLPALLLLASLLVSPTLAADETPELVQARVEFTNGVALTDKADWGAALAAFERSAKLRPHSLTTYNMGACERALSRYTRARRTLRAALDQNEKAGGKELADSFQNEAKAWISQINQLVAVVHVTMAPAEATIAVDGRPLEVEAQEPGKTPLLIAGVSTPGLGKTPPAGVFDLELDPGLHVFTLDRKGFSTAVLNKTFGSGKQLPLSIELALLPATLRVSADKDGAVVTVNGKDIGVAPVEVSRPAGSYTIVVTKAGHDEYRTTVNVGAGEENNLKATLVETRIPVTKRWWFWTSAAALVGGGVALTYFLTRPSPQPPPFSGGSTGWVTYPQP